MKGRLSQVVLSLLITLAVYQVYAVFAVPLIEPQPDLTRGPEVPPIVPADQRLQKRLEELAAFFPGRGHLIKNSKMLEVDQTTLLFQDYWNLGEGRALVRPCFLILDNRGQAEGKWPAALPNVLILEALDGAIFQFDRPLDFRMARIGRFIAGQILGNVIVRGEDTSPQRRDFRLTTRDITVTEHRIWTNHPLELSWGRHRARGAGMEIVFKGRTPFSQQDVSRESMAIERLLLRHVDRLHLDLASLKVNQRSPVEIAGGESPPGQTDEESLDISCQGPLIFIPAQRTLTLEDRVDVARIQKGQRTVQIRCQQLVVTFQNERDTAESAQIQTPDQGVVNRSNAGGQQTQSDVGAITERWSLHLVRALGQPVQIIFPAWRGQMEGEDLRYDALSGTLSLEGRSGITGKREQDTFQARSIQCQVDGSGNLQTLAAAGPGQIVATNTSDKNAWSVSWAKVLTLTSQETERMLFLEGEARIAAQSLGQLQAEQLWCWCAVSNQAGFDLTSLRVRRFVAQSRVEISSPQFQARTERLESWVQWADSASESSAGTAPNSAKGQGELFASGPSRQSSETGQIVLQAQLIRTEFRVEGKGIVRVSALSADGQVIADEVVTASGQHPFHLRADRLQVSDPAGMQGVFSLTGTPAFVAGRGLALTGQQIYLDRARNQLSVAGAGRLDIEPGESSAVPWKLKQRVDIQWTNGMDFTGRVLAFQGGVQIVAGPQRLQAQAVQMELEQPINLADPSSFGAHRIRAARATGQVLAESLDLDFQGKMVARDTLRVSEIAIDFQSGAITAPGAGRFTTLRELASLSGPLTGISGNPGGSEKVLSAGPGESRAISGGNMAPPALPEPVGGGLPMTQSSISQSESPQLVMLDVTFHQDLRGNLVQKQIGCRGRVKARYGRAADWNTQALPDDPSLLGADGMLLQCQELTAFQITAPGEARPHLELMAQGNVTVESQFHTARARRLSLDQSKTLLVLEGDGDVPAELFRQEFRGGPVQKTSARRIYYWYGTRTFKVDDAKSLEISQNPLTPGDR